MSLKDTTRQEAILERLTRCVEKSPDIGAMLLVGSFASGTADVVSDLDLFLITYEGRFEQAWKRRDELHVTGAIVHWDEQAGEPHSVAGHRWVTPELVLVESVISAPRDGARLAAPFKLVVGDTRLVENFPRRPPIDRSEMTDEATHPVDSAYEELKEAVRRHFRTHG
ncbi:MAG: nucleotidyltransferase domain-containing protein [Actinomycetota bacterium]